MTAVSEQTPTQDTNTSKELANPLCVVERYVPSAENWAKIKPRILEMEKACFQDRTKGTLSFYGFKENTLDTLFTRNDGTRHIMLLKMSDVIVGWISARPLGYENHIKPLTEYNDSEDPQYAAENNRFAEYYGDILPVSQEKHEQDDSIPRHAYISHIVVYRNLDDVKHCPPHGSAELLERVMFQHLKKNNYEYAALDAVVATEPGDDPDGYAGRFRDRHKDQIVFSERHHRYADADPPLPGQIHIVVKIFEKYPEKAVQSDER